MNLIKHLSKEESWCKSIWNALEGDKREGIKAKDVKTFIAVIMRIPTTTTESNTITKSYTTFTDNELTLTQQQVNRIQNDFHLLYLNRKAYRSTEEKLITDSECTFKPSLCEASLFMTESGSTHSIKKMVKYFEDVKAKQEE